MNYTTGTITLTNGSKSVTGTGTGWTTALIVGGVIFPQAAGNPLPIASVDSQTKITAATAWVGASGTYPYALQRQDDATQMIANAEALATYIQRLDNASLSALAGLTPQADRLAYYNGSGTAALTVLSAFARSLLDDQNSSTALSTLGVTNFAKTLLDDADAATARATIGAQANLGYTPVDRSDPLMTQTVNVKGSETIPGYVLTRAVVLRQSDSSGALSAIWRAQERQGYYYSMFWDLNFGNDGRRLEFRSDGSLWVPGAINGASKNFVIDHPLDPSNRDLTFASTESPHYGVEAWGVARLKGGRVTVDIDAASNLTAGTWAALTQNTIVTALQNQEGFARLRPGPIEDGTFEIVAEDEACCDLVSWHVVADRNDPVIRSLSNADPETGLLEPESEKSAAP
ncbi:hypothetical protein [Martelella limonii]|uniref:hypothetical protein n=1 Tax=Martelella limonii TaxID=1647649 RepID=UPI00158111C2|nr:hypothetical protein [Martelella limonii]